MALSLLHKIQLVYQLHTAACGVKTLEDIPNLESDIINSLLSVSSTDQLANVVEQLCPYAYDNPAIFVSDYINATNSTSLIDISDLIHQYTQTIEHSYYNDTLSILVPEKKHTECELLSSQQCSELKLRLLQHWDNVTIYYQGNGSICIEIPVSGDTYTITYATLNDLFKALFRD